MLGHRAGIHRYMRTKNCLHPIWPAWIKTGYQQQQKQQKAYKFIGIKQYLLNKKMDPDRNKEIENFLEFSDNKYTTYLMSCGLVCEAIFKLIIDIRRPRQLWVMQIWVGRVSLYKKSTAQSSGRNPVSRTPLRPLLHFILPGSYKSCSAFPLRPIVSQDL